MKISYNWLKEYVDFDLTPEEVSAALTSIGLEVEHFEEVEEIPGGLAGVVVAEVFVSLYLIITGLGGGKVGDRG